MLHMRARRARRAERAALLRRAPRAMMFAFTRRVHGTRGGVAQRMRSALPIQAPRATARSALQRHATQRTPAGFFDAVADYRFPAALSISLMLAAILLVHARHA